MSFAAKQHDQILKDTGKAQVSEMNYKPDGSRIIHSTESGPRSSKDEEKEATQNAIVPELANVNLKVWMILVIENGLTHR